MKGYCRGEMSTARRKKASLHKRTVKLPFLVLRDSLLYVFLVCWSVERELESSVEKWYSGSIKTLVGIIKSARKIAFSFCNAILNCSVFLCCSALL